MSWQSILDWLKNQEPTLQKEWQALKIGQHDGLELFRPLYHMLVDAATRQSPPDEKELEEWSQEPGIQKLDLQDLINAVLALRTMLEQKADTQHATQVQQLLSPLLDQTAATLAGLYLAAAEQKFNERLGKAERYLASTLVKATENADRALSQLRSVYEISQALGASLDVDQIVNELVRKLGLALNAQHCAVWLSDIGTLNALATYGQSESTPTSIPLDNPENIVNIVLNSTEPLILEQGQHAEGDQLISDLEVHYLLLAPLLVQNIAIGVLTLGRIQDIEQFDPTEINLVESILRQAAFAIQNAGLYEEISALNRSLEDRIMARTRELAQEKERIETLYAISSELSKTLDLSQVLDKTIQLITQAVGAKYGSIMLLDRELNTLVCRAQLGDEEPLPPQGKITPFRPGVGMAGWVLEHGEPALVHDVLEDDRWLDKPGNEQTRSMIAAPLVSGQEAYGVIIISDHRPKAFDESKLKLLIASAQQVAQAIHNAQLYKDVNTNATRNRAILQSIADGVIVNDPKEQVIVFNAAAERILRKTQQGVLGRDVRGLFETFEKGGRESALAAIEMVSTSNDREAEHAVETTMETENQVVSAHIAPVVAENNDFLGVVTALRDITREVQADRAKTEFVSTVSHELRTPLTSIKGYTDLLHAGAVGGINDQQKRFLGTIKTNADRLTALINDLLDISRIETGRIKLDMQPVNMREVVEEVLESLGGQIKDKGLSLEAELPETVENVYGDRARLVQIVTNLVGNSAKYTDEGWIRVSLTSLQGAVRLDVADSGIGISTKDHGRIFERFYRADTPVVEGRGGTGLGLSITKQLTELHGGRIWVQSELGLGSTFTVILPTVAQKLPPSLLTSLPPGAKKILVVDDERDIVALLRHQLESKGYQVIIAMTGEQAIQKAIAEQPNLITLDILLPDRNGFDVLRELGMHSETSHIPVIVLSIVQDETNGYRLGAADYITKPVDGKRLLTSISRVLSQKDKVLIAEDDIDTAEMLIELLESHGFQPLHALDGYEALSMARRERPGLILLDLRMPGMDGYEALTRLKKDPETRNIPILTMSAHAVDAVQERNRLQKMGAYDFFSKPFSLDELIQEIEEMHQVYPETTDDSTDTDQPTSE